MPACRIMPSDARIHLDFVHRLRFTRDVFATTNTTLLDALASPDPATAAGDRPGPARALLCLDKGLAEARPDLLGAAAAYQQAHAARFAFTGEPVVVPGGERAKNDPAVLQAILRAIHDAGLCRRSYLIVAGGGAVLDVAGYAAATAHRGIRLVRIPSTTLSQDDSGVGVKNGVNAFGKKNYLGAFAVPWAVINDEALLETLSERDWRAGFSEAVKVALLKDPALFERIEHAAAAIRGSGSGGRDMEAAVPIIRHSAELHLEHIARGGDPFELLHARPLDFGHWAAHKLEQLTDFDLSHGDAVSIGLALDVTYARMTRLLDGVTADRILRALESLGLPLSHPRLGDSAILEGLEEFREHLGGRLAITLVTGVGQPVEVHEMDAALVRRAASELLARHPACAANGYHRSSA